MNDERFLKDWLDDTTDSTTDPNAAADKVVSQIPDTPQRRRWLPWPPAHRPKSEEPNGRTRFMFSPVSAITIGALVLAASGALYMAQSPSQEAAPAPGSESGPESAPSLFTGSVGFDPVCSTPSQGPRIDSVQPRLRRERDEVYFCFLWETTDPRLNGISTIVWNNDIIGASDAGPGGRIQSGRERITTSDGSWEGTLTHLVVDDGLELESGWYVGAGAYDGLVAYITLQDGGDSIWGYVSDDPPPMPESVPVAD